MSVTYAEEVCVRFLWECDTSNKPFEWTGHLLLFALLALTPRLPLKGSVRRMRRKAALRGRSQLATVGGWLKSARRSASSDGLRVCLI
jgi:hypothetical protein